MKSFKNRKASFQYHFIEDIECGIVLKGTEIKSIRQGKVSFKDSYAKIKDDEIWLINLHIAAYDKTAYFNHEPERPRKLLAHKRQIVKLRKKLDEKGYTLVPKSLYINDAGKCKVMLALAQGKKLHDKRQDIKEKDIKKDTLRRLKAF